MRDWPLTVAHPPVAAVEPVKPVDPVNPVDPVDPVEPLDLTMSRSEAVGYVRSMIRTNTNGSIKRLKRNCSRRSESSYRCQISWRIGRRSYSGTATFRHSEANGEAYWAYTFKGKRRQPGRNAQKVSW